METNGLYVEVSEPCDGKPQFINMDHHKNRAPLVLSWSSAEQQWSIRKVVAFHAEKRVYYIASALTGADVTGDMPPTGAWVISGTVEKEEKYFPGKRYFKHSVEVGQRAQPSDSYHSGSPAHSGKTDKKEYVDHLDPPPRLKLLAEGEELPADLISFRNLPLLASMLF